MKTETDQHVYESKEAFQAEWVTVKQPIVPERVLPNPNYTTETYAVCVLFEEDATLQFYDTDESLRPLSVLAEQTFVPASKIDSSPPTKVSEPEPSVTEEADSPHADEQPDISLRFER